MNQTPHTPGPWIPCPGNAGQQYRIETKRSDNNLCEIATLRGPDRIANAALIAAAPDLLAACEEIIEHGTDDWDARAKTIRAAIAKARGQ